MPPNDVPNQGPAARYSRDAKDGLVKQPLIGSTTARLRAAGRSRAARSSFRRPGRRGESVRNNLYL